MVVDKVGARVVDKEILLGAFLYLYKCLSEDEQAAVTALFVHSNPAPLRLIVRHKDQEFQSTLDVLIAECA